MGTGIRRVIVVVLDGLRPDAIDAFELSNVRTLMDAGAWSRDATTVGPSLTAAAMTSLMTGVSPARHGITSETILIPRTNAGLSPLPDLLAARGYPSSAFMGAVAPIFRGLASRVAKRLGFGVSRFAGKGAEEILATARTTIKEQRRGLIVLHWPDADNAGHTHGWMSEPYRQGCVALDRALGSLAVGADIVNDPSTLLIALADHGGGGVVANDHESDHPFDRTIPLLVSGQAVMRVQLLAPRLVDVPATALWALGIPLPSSYEGRVLHEAFAVADAMTPVR